MKAIKKKISGISMKRNILCLAVIILSHFAIKAQSTIQIGLVEHCPNGQVMIPVTAANLTNLGAMALVINYDNTSLVYNTLTNINPTINSAGTIIHETIPSSELISLQWYSNMSSTVSFTTTDTLFMLVFDHIAGSSAVSIYNSAQYITEITDDQGNTINNINFINGGVVIPSPPLTTVISGDTIYCENAIATLTALPTGGGGNNYAFQWNGPSSFNATTASINIPGFTMINTGTYTVNVTELSSLCTNTESINLYMYPIPQVDIIPDAGFCNGESTTSITFSGIVPGSTFSWVNSNPAIGLAASGNDSIPSFTAINPGTAAITATITVTPEANACFGPPKSFIITIYPTPTANPVSDLSVCNGDQVNSINFSGPVNGTSFSWTNDNTSIGLIAGANGNLPSFQAINLTNIPVIATITIIPSTVNCTGTPYTFTITVKPSPNVGTVLPDTVCVGDFTQAFNFTSNVTGTTFQWTNSNIAIGLSSGNTGDIPSFQGTNVTNQPISGTITVIPTAFSCVGTSTNFTITVLPEPTINPISNYDYCHGETTIPVNPLSNVTGTTFTWTNSNTSIGLGGSGTGAIPSFTATNTGSTPVTATITITPTANNCPGTNLQYTITVYPLPIAYAGPDGTSSYNTQPILTGSVSNSAGPFTWSWTPTGLLNAPFNQQTVQTQALTASQYFYLVVTDLTSTCVSLQDTVLITVTGGPLFVAITATPDTICQNDPVNITSLTSGGNLPFTYQWSSIPGGSLPETTASITVNPTVTTIYYVTVTDSTNQVWIASDTVVFNDVSPGTIGSNVTICYNTSPPTFTSPVLPTGSGTLSYEWQYSTDGGTTWASTGSTVINYNPGPLTVETWYRRVTTSTLGILACNATSNIVNVYINNITAGIIIDDQTICNGMVPDPLTGTAPTTAGTVTYQWQSSTLPSGPWANIPLATSQNYSPPALTVNTCYRRIDMSNYNGASCSDTSNVVCITINYVTGGTLAADQVICSGDDPNSFTVVTLPTVTGDTSYQWFSGPSQTSMTPLVPPCITATYNPLPLTVTTYYQRITNSTLNGIGCSTNSNILQVFINDIDAGAISGDQIICSGDIPATLTNTTAGSGSGVISYKWLSGNSATGPWTPVTPAATGLTYSPPATTITAWYIRVAYSTYNLTNTCNDSSNIVKVTVNAITAGVIGSNQTICYNSDPVAFSVLTAPIGLGAIGYQWQSASTAGGPWVNIAGSNTAIYNPPALTANTWYRRIDYSVYNNDTCQDTTNVLSITINNIIPAVIGSDQTICTNSDPVAFTIITPPTGTALTYKWISSTTGPNGPWTVISGATLATYNPPVISQNTYYAQIATSTLNGVSCSDTSNIVCVTINNVDPGSIAANQVICYGNNPAAFTSITPGTGAGIIHYQWQSALSPTSTFNNTSPVDTLLTYDPPSLTINTWYRRMVISTLNGVSCTTYTTVVSITINTVSSGVVATDQTICNNSTPVAFTVQTPASGLGNLTYQWQLSPNQVNWTNISGATASTYAPPSLSDTTWYRRIVFSNLPNTGPPYSSSCPDTSNSLKITINYVTGGVIATEQTICPGDDIALLTEITPSSGSGQLNYSWEFSINSGTSWTSIPLTNSTTYNPTTITLPTCYRRKTRSTLNGLNCEATSNVVCITINTINPGVIGSNQTICAGDNPVAFTVPTPAIVPGTISYQWQSSTVSANGSWTNITGATQATYDPPALTVTTWYRRVVYSFLNNVMCDSAGNVLKVTVNQLPLANAGTNQGINYGCSAQLNGSGSGGTSYTYSWLPVNMLVSGQATLANPQTVNLTATQEYVLQVTETVTGCISLYDTVIVTVNGSALALTVSATPTQICNGDQTQLQADASSGNLTYTYSWSSVPSGFSSSISSPTAAPASNTTYQVTVNDGCNSISGSVIVNVTQKPEIFSSVDTIICVGSNGYTINTSFGANYDSLIWTNPGGDGTFSSNIILNPVYYPGYYDSLNGSVVLSVTAYGATPCFDTTHSFTLTISPLTTAYAGRDTSICERDTFSLSLANATSNNANSLNWTTSGSGYFDDPSIINPVYHISSFDVSNGYVVLTLHAVNTMLYCGDSTHSMTLTIRPLPHTNAGSDKTICLNDSVQLNASGGTSYLWSPPVGLSNVAIPDPYAMPSVTTSYFVTAFDDGCYSEDTVVVFINPLPNANAGNDVAVCQGDSAILTATGGFIYLWSTGAHEPMAVVFPLTNTMYYVTVTDVNLCSNSDSVEVSVNPLPVISITPHNPAICMDSTIEITGHGASIYYWSPSTSLSSFMGTTVTAFPEITTTYRVTGISTDNCPNTTEFKINVYETPVSILTDTSYLCMGDELILNAGFNMNAEYLWQDGSSSQYYEVLAPGYYWVAIQNEGCTIVDTAYVDVCTDLWIPNAFTPDQNNINDFWLPKAFTPLKSYDLKIFNRWGEILFESHDIEIGWDGKVNGNDCPEGSYMYLITYLGQANIASEREGKLRGYFLLIR